MNVTFNSQIETRFLIMDPEDTSVNLETVPLFTGLNQRQLDWIRRRLNIHSFPPGLDIIVSGTPGEVIYMILHGTVRVYVPKLDGTQVTLNLMGPGDTVGEMSVLDSALRSASVITLEQTEVAWMDRGDFQEALNTIPLLAQNLLRILSGRLRLNTERILSLASMNIPARIAHQLLAIASVYGQTDPSGSIYIPVRLTQEDIAELVGASRKRVNQVMVALKHENLATSDTSGHITIHTPPDLRAWSEAQ